MQEVLKLKGGETCEDYISGKSSKFLKIRMKDLLILSARDGNRD